MGRLRPRLTYANVVSTACLFILLGGGAYAAERWVITSTDQIKPSVLSQLQDGASTAAKKKKKKARRGPAGPPGAPGAPGTARAYTAVTGHGFFPCNPNCNLTTARTKGVSSVTHPGTGLYCVTAPGIDGGTVAPVVSVTPNGSTPNPGSTSAMVDTSTPDCPAGTVQVTTQRLTGATTSAVSDTVSFTIAIP